MIETLILLSHPDYARSRANRALAEAAVKGRVVRTEDRAMQRAAAQLLPLLRAGNGRAAAALANRLMPFGALAK